MKNEKELEIDESLFDDEVEPEGFPQPYSQKTVPANYERLHKVDTLDGDRFLPQLHSDSEKSGLKLKILAALQDYGVALSLDIMSVVVDEMIEHMEDTEYNYILDMFRAVDIPLFETPTLTEEEKEKVHAQMKKDAPTVAVPVPFGALKSAVHGARLDKVSRGEK